MIEFHLRHKAPKLRPVRMAFSWVAKYWFEVIVTIFLLQLYTNRHVQLTVSAGDGRAFAIVSQKTTTTFRPLTGDYDELSAMPALTVPAEKKEAPLPHWKPSDFRNLSFVLDPALAKRKRVGDDIVKQKLNNCRAYVRRFAKLAMVEMEKYGIPASITLAQGLLESDAGDSRLATESNNHFGIKCRSKCRGCTCRNYADDTTYDMFRVFGSAWESYREHSLLLQIPRYRHLKKLGTKNYKAWATGLKKAGYATDPDYARKLIRIIEVLDLHQFDRDGA
ncbi:MAG TPA: hypothetical protein ENJ20_00180 [Bacteroidetes bacterium]|nr:hypothetical protein [Bacteroidota bacterium]